MLRLHFLLSALFGVGATTSDALLIFGLPTPAVPFLFPFPSSTFSLSAAPTPSHPTPPPTKNFSSPISPALTCSPLPLSPFPIPSFPLPLILPRCHPLPHFRPLHPATFSVFVFSLLGKGVDLGWIRRYLPSSWRLCLSEGERTKGYWA